MWHYRKTTTRFLMHFVPFLYMEGQGLGGGWSSYGAVWVKIDVRRATEAICSRRHPISFPRNISSALRMLAALPAPLQTHPLSRLVK